ncbi:MAG: M23 family metallopeptidase [Clostridia bacterium]|nr:M23 family metallopeptidase [Clostridia bacterium]
MVGKNYTLDYVIAHSEGEVVELVKDCNENTSGEAKYGSKRVENIYGNYVKIKHPNGMYTLYAHLQYGSVDVNLKDKVKKGQVIGFMGNTGYSFGAHLHFEVRDENNVKIDAIKYIDADLEGNTINYSIGNYVCDFDMKVRNGPALSFFVKKVSELTADGKKNATSQNLNAYAVYKKGTVFTAMEIFKSTIDVWAKTPSGYICLTDNEMKYCSKL